MAPTVVTPPGTSPILNASNLTFPSSTNSSNSTYHGYDHITWLVGNAKQAASYFITRLGFRPLAYKGLETSSRHIATHVVYNAGVIFAFTSAIQSASSPSLSDSERREVEDIYKYLEKHGDAVKDVAFGVDDATAVYKAAVERGAIPIQEPTVLRGEKGEGEVVIAKIRTYGDTTHTLVERRGYRGVFLPGFKDVRTKDENTINELLPSVHLEAIDHCVGNQDWGEMEAACD